LAPAAAGRNIANRCVLGLEDCHQSRSTRYILHDGPLRVYYCHGLSCSTSGLLLSCFIMLRFRFTTVTGPLHVYYMSNSYTIKKIPLISLSVFYHHVSVFFSSSLPRFIFLFDTVILSKQGSLLFTTRVFLYTKQNDPCHG